MKIPFATLKADKFYERTPIDACDKNWVHIAEHVKAAKFHHNYRDPDEQVEYKLGQRRRRSALPSSTNEHD
jgi:hypothetical protein